MSEPAVIPPPADPPPRRRVDTPRTAQFVDAQIRPIQEQYVRGNQPSPYSRAVLARLRRGLGKPLGAIPELLELVIDPEPGAPPSRDGEATPEEIATYTAITLYALHQQSQSKRMHVRDRSFASAVGSLRYTGGEENEGVIRRFQAMGTASGIDELVHHARGLVTLLRTAGRGFDYSRFAQDLADFQHPRRTDRVRLSWGRDFYRANPRPTTATLEEPS